MHVRAMSCGFVRASTHHAPTTLLCSAANTLFHIQKKVLGLQKASRTMATCKRYYPAEVLNKCEKFCATSNPISADTCNKCSPVAWTNHSIVIKTCNPSICHMARYLLHVVTSRGSPPTAGGHTACSEGRRGACQLPSCNAELGAA